MAQKEKVTKKEEKLTNQVTKEELETLQNLRSTNAQNLNKLGLLEFRILKAEEEKWALKEEIVDIDQKYLDTLKELKEKYGKVEIDLETGEFTPEDESTPEVAETPEVV